MIQVSDTFLSRRHWPAIQFLHIQKHTLKVVRLALHGAEAADLPKELVNVPGKRLLSLQHLRMGR